MDISSPFRLRLDRRRRCCPIPCRKKFVPYSTFGYNESCSTSDNAYLELKFHSSNDRGPEAKAEMFMSMECIKNNVYV